jgi:hypothetical protein
VSEEANERRKRRLRTLTIRRYALGTEPDEDLRGTTIAAERLAMMWPLALRAWELSGRSLPVYERGEIPARVVRGSR